MASRGEGPLLRGIGRGSMVALFINAVVGAGIFGLPARVHELLGPWALLAYVACALLVLLVVLCFAEVGSRFEETGGPYLYARTAFGPFVGFQVGWLVWLTRVTAFAALCNLLIDYLAHAWPAVASTGGRVAVASLATLAIAAVNIRGVRTAAIVANVFTIGKLVPLLLFVGVGMFFVEPALYVPETAPSVGDFSSAMLLLVFAFTGFETATVPAGEVRDPRRTLPFAILVSMAVIAPLYLLIQAVSIGTLPGLASSTTPLADAAGRFAGSLGAGVIVLGALVSISGTLNGLVLAAPRILYAMAEQGQLPAVFSRTHARYRTPHWAIALTALCMLALTLSGSFLTAVALSTITRLLAYAATCIAVPVLRRRAAGGGMAPAAFSVPGGPWVVGTALLVIAWLVLHARPEELRNVAIAMLVGALLMGAAALAAGRASPRA
ncbi:amino acid permease [Luteimonas marina]|uniref:Arginine/agmatine antiporter n=1 Tax=Luteimonas marina TaxID=488485 RepID=A0A5C5UBB5_9GAMM|nr:APC family permease [Luteimonas marina]TWT23167.1 amino acid permease [Luteimonas marina]